MAAKEMDAHESIVLEVLWPEIFRSISSRMHCKEDSNMYSQKSDCAALFPIFHIHTSVSDFYISRIGPPILLQPNRQTNRGNV